MIYGDQKYARHINKMSKGIVKGMKNTEMMLNFMNLERLYWYDVSNLKNSDWSWTELIVEEKGWEKHL